MKERDFEFRCRQDFFNHVKKYDDYQYQRLGHEYLGKKCCGKTMMLTRKFDYKSIRECPKGNCVMGLEETCRCWSCYGKFHGAERWRNFNLKGTMDEYLIHRDLKVDFKFN